MAKSDSGAKTGRKAGAKRPEKRIPKTVAGVKLPKDIRRAGDAIFAKAASPEGKAMIAGGLSMAVAGIAAMAERTRTEASRADAATPPSAAGPTPPSGIDQPQAIVDTVGHAVEAAIGRLLKRL